MKYRADIDGLRAISVLSVLAFHLGVSRAPGGFIGVDVFFVISGFLITSLIAGDLEQSRFSLRRFYERRIRRIAPALAVVLAATTAGAAWLLFPAPFRDYGQSLVAATLSASNIYFWQTSNYFSAPAGALPLLHTWSLAVEEQFYLVFPLLLAWLYKLRRLARVAAIAAIVAASFAYSVVLTARDPVAAFYLPQSRAWELGLGALLALNVVPAPTASWARSILGGGGLVMIGASVLTLDADAPFPGVAALAPCLGAALVIHAGRGGEGLVQRLLALRPLAFIGLISYSLYLWHWPVIVLAKAATGANDLSHVEQVFAALLSIVLAALTWAFVEQPCRRAPVARATVFRTAGAATAALVACAAVVVVSGGAPQRYPSDVAKLASFVDYPVRDAAFRAGACFIDSRYRAADFDPRACLQATPGRKQVVLMGDSHAAHLWSALAKVAADTDVLQATASGCIPTVVARPGSATRCTDVIQMMYGSVLPRRPGAVVVLSAEWQAKDDRLLVQTFDWARRHRIRLVLLGPSVEYDQPLPLLLAEARQRRDPALPDRHLIPGFAQADRKLARLAASHGVAYVSLYDLVCPAGRCRHQAPSGAPMQFDSDHFTQDGAFYVASLIERQGVLRQ